MTHQVNIFLLLFGALQGALLSIWFLRKQQNRLANTYFSLFLVIVGLQLTFKVITKAWLMHQVLFAYLISYKLPFLAGPSLFLYVKARKDEQFRVRDLIHFLPFVLISLLDLVPLPGVRYHMYTQAALQVISLIAYGVAAVRLGNPELKKFIVIVILAEIVVAITLALMYQFFGRFPDVRLLFVALTLLIYWISFIALSKPDFFNESASAPVISMGLGKSTKYAHSSLKVEEARRIETDLQRIMATEKPYLDSGLTIDSLAQRLGTSRHHLSQVCNERMGRSYLDFICDLRLEEAKTRLSNPANLRFTIAAVALDSGFNSVSTFNDAFKRRYQITPSKFRDGHLNQMSA